MARLKRGPLAIVLGMVFVAACGSTSHDESEGIGDASPDVAGPDASESGADTDGDATLDVGADSVGEVDAEPDPFGVCNDAGVAPVPKAWRITCCNGKVCQGTCEQGACVCGDVVGGCEQLRCCDVAGGSQVVLVCGGQGVCEQFQ